MYNVFNKGEKNYMELKSKRIEVNYGTSKSGKAYCRLDFFFEGVDGEEVRISYFPSYLERRLLGIN